MDLFSPKHLLILFAIILLVFGTKKLRTIGSDLGQAVRGFKESMKEGEHEQELPPTAQTPPASQAAPVPPPQISGHERVAEKVAPVSEKTSA